MNLYQKRTHSELAERDKGGLRQLSKLRRQMMAAGFRKGYAE